MNYGFLITAKLNIKLPHKLGKFCKLLPNGRNYEDFYGIGNKGNTIQLQ